MNLLDKFASITSQVKFSPLTSNLDCSDESASWRIKSLDVTWHSQRPSSKCREARLINRVQSLPRPLAHSYLSGCMPTGLRSFCQMHWPRLSCTVQGSCTSSPDDTS